MPSEIPSLAIFELLPGKEDGALSTMRELMSTLAARGYSRDLLYRHRDGLKAPRYVLVRYWKSEDCRRRAAEDPEILRYWERLSHLIEIVTVYETLEDV
jgi:hypothetical protein